MLYLSSLLIEYKDVESFDQLIDIVKEKAKQGEIFIKISDSNSSLCSV